MEKIIRFNRTTVKNNTTGNNDRLNSVIVRKEETKIISFNSKNGMNEMQAYQKILSLYKKEF